jgi:small subunit ribosomal protein S5
MQPVCLVGDTIAHEVEGRHGSVKVLLLPASPGTGVKAGGTVRSILQATGVHNVLSKVYGPTNPINVAKATVKALYSMQSRADVERLRGVKLDVHHPQAESKTPAAQAPAQQQPQEQAAAAATD